MTVFLCAVILTRCCKNSFALCNLGAIDKRSEVLSLGVLGSPSSTKQTKKGIFCERSLGTLGTHIDNVEVPHSKNSLRCNVEVTIPTFLKDPDCVSSSYDSLSGSLQ